MVITIQIEILENLIRTNKIGNWDPFTSFFFVTKHTRYEIHATVTNLSLVLS